MGTLNSNVENFQLGTRRLKILAVDPDFVMKMYGTGFRVRDGYKIIKGIPDDAKIMAVTYDPFLHGVIFVVTSPEFDEVPMGEELPVVAVDIELDAISETNSSQSESPTNP